MSIIYPECDIRIEMFRSQEAAEACGKKTGIVSGVIIAIVLGIIAICVYIGDRTNTSLIMLLIAGAAAALFILPRFTEYTNGAKWRTADAKIRSIMLPSESAFEFSNPEEYQRQRQTAVQKIIQIDQQEESLLLQSRTPSYSSFKHLKFSRSN